MHLSKVLKQLIPITQFNKGKASQLFSRVKDGETLVVMKNGEIQQVGTPEEIYNEPANRYVANFIGESNILDGIMKEDFTVEFNNIKFKCVDKGFKHNEPVDVVIRPEDVILTAPEKSEMKGTVTSIIFRGVHYEMDVMANGYEWLVHSTKMEPVGTEVGIYVEPENIQIMHKPRSKDEEAVSIDE